MEAIWDFVGNLLVALGIFFTTLSSIFILISGLVSLFFGRRLFWVFVATLGFMIGLLFSDNVLAYLPPALEPFKEFVRLGFAVLVAFIALGLQRFGVVVAGGLAVGVLGWYMAGSLEVSTLLRWGIAGVAGLIAAALLWFSHDWMLILITAVTGALIGVVGANQINPLPTGSALWVYLVLVAAGIFYQYRELGRTRTEAILVSAPPSDGKPAARTHFPFFKRTIAVSANTPVSLIESTGAGAPAGAVAATVAATAAATPESAPASAIAPAKPASAAPIAPVAVATPVKSLAPAPPKPVAPPAPALSPSRLTAPAQPALSSQAASPSQPTSASQATLPAKPAPTQNVDGQIVVLDHHNGQWLRLPRWKKSSQAGQQALPESQLQPLEPGQPRSSALFKSAPEAYG